MIKDILKTVGIVAFFALLGYVLTYPYEVELPKNKDIVLNGDILKNQSLEDIINSPELKNNILYIKELTPTSLEKFANANKLYEKYKDKNVKFVYVYDSNILSKRDRDYTRMWKMMLKKYPYKGCHFLVSKRFLVYIMNKKTPEDLEKIGALRFKCILVNLKGQIIARNAPNILNNPEAVSKKLDSLLKFQNNDTIISK